jgi:hypothetical protein
LEAPLRQSCKIIAVISTLSKLTFRTATAHYYKRLPLKVVYDDRC